ncbi:MAG: hypothetical protein Q8P18_21765 [Pseudomonadota bacterium]|nr:hypothetical protein [Pseudomonadota bacterium]
MTLLALSVFSACSDYQLEVELEEPGAAYPEGPHPLPPATPSPAPVIEVQPTFHDFGEGVPWEAVTQSVTVTNVGHKALEVTGLRYDTASVELSFSADEATNGQLPWVLQPGESRVTQVTYTPIDEGADQGTLVVDSNDPVQPRVDALQVGAARFTGFTTGWYIVNDDTPYDLTSNAAYRVDYDGDPDAYWYEPSGNNGMTASTDVPGDFADLRDYVITRAGGPTPVTGPLSFYAPSELPDMLEGSFSYILCDFWMDPSDDPARYSISSGPVDDGVRVIVNGAILGELSYNQSGSWPLTNAVPGEVNTLVVILMDNAMWEKYVNDLAFYKDGVMVGG